MCDQQVASASGVCLHWLGSSGRQHALLSSPNVCNKEEEWSIQGWSFAISRPSFSYIPTRQVRPHSEWSGSIASWYRKTYLNHRRPSPTVSLLHRKESK